MSLGNPDKKKITRKLANTPNEGEGPEYYDQDWHWERGDLKDTEKIMKHNVKVTENGAKYGGRNAGTGEKIPKEHFQKNLYYEKQALNRVQDEIKKRRLAKGLRDKAVSVKESKLRKRDKIDDYLED